MKTAPPAPGRCLVCGRELTWPMLYFDRAECVEARIARAREQDGELGSADPRARTALGRRRKR